MLSLARLARAARVALASRPEERWFAARAWLLAPAVEVALATVGARATLGWLAWLPAAGPLRRARSVGVEEGAAWVDRAYAVHLLRGQCLPRAIVQHAVHRLDGTPSRVFIGVRRGDTPPGSLDAHAWVAAPGSGEPAAPFEVVLIADEQGVRAPDPSR